MAQERTTDAPDPAADRPASTAHNGPHPPPPTEPGRARDLVRGPRRPRPKPADTGRQHHLGGAPAGMPVLGEAGDDAGTRMTRAATVQLADRTGHELGLLERAVGADMERAAAALDFEAAAWHRDELARVRAEIASRARG